MGITGPQMMLATNNNVISPALLQRLSLVPMQHNALLKFSPKSRGKLKVSYVLGRTPRHGFCINTKCSKAHISNFAIVTNIVILKRYVYTFLLYTMLKACTAQKKVMLLYILFIRCSLRL